MIYFLNNYIFKNKLYDLIYIILFLQFLGFVFLIINHFKKKINNGFFAILFLISFISVLSSIFYTEYATLSIQNVNDFKKISINPNGHYEITNDINMNNYKLEGDFNFYGTLEGNGYNLNGLKTPLFNLLRNAKINNINLTNVEIKMADESTVGALSKEAFLSKISQLNVSGIIEGKNYVGGLVGTGSKINRSYVNAKIFGDYYVGGFSGGSSHIYNSISNSHIIGNEISGSCSSIQHEECYTENLIILGTIEVKQNIVNFLYLIDTSENKNNLFLGNVISNEKTIFINSGKVIVLDDNITINENYENIVVVNIEKLKTKEFYLNHQFDPSIWNFDLIDNLFVPNINEAKFENIPIKSE